jgi:hypothetical protein
MPPKKITTIAAAKKEMDSAFNVDDLYKACPSVDDKYQQKGGVFKHPARVMGAGPSGSGKTNLAGNLALNHFVWDTITIFAKNTEQPVFELLKKYLEKAIEKNGGSVEDQFHISNEIDRDPKDYDQNLQHLVIIDDLTHKDDKKNGSLAAKFFKYGRPQNISTIVLTQNFHDTNKNVRENVNYYITFKGRDPDDINKMRKYYASDLKRDEFDSLYEKATKKENCEDRSCFLTIICDETELGKKYRRGLVPYSLIPRDATAVPEPNKTKLNVKSWKQEESQGGSGSGSGSAVTKVWKSSHGPRYSVPQPDSSDDEDEEEYEAGSGMGLNYRMAQLPRSRFGTTTPAHKFPAREMFRRM